MPPKPVLRTKVAKLRKKGLSIQQIAKRLKITPNAVGLHLTEMKKIAGVPLRSWGTVGECRAVRIPVTYLEALQEEAQARGISASMLARKIVEAVIDEDLFVAVLDEKPK